MPHRIIVSRLFQELSFLASIPLLHVLAAIDASAVSNIITSIIGAVVGFFAVKFYRAQTRKSEVEREVAELERDAMRRKAKLSRKTKSEDNELD